MLACLVQIDGYDPVAGTAVSLYAASHDDPRLCHLNGATWWPALTKLPTLRYDLFDGSFGGQITAPSSSLSMAIEPWPNFGRYALADARFRLWTGELGDPWANFTLRFDGRVSSQPKLKDQVAPIDFSADDRWLDGSLLQTYAGTTGIEGPAAMKGEPKPVAIGAPRYVPGKLVDPTNSVFQVNNGATHAFEYALERLARFGSAAADYASFTALVAATIPAGSWATAKSVGFARLGAPPDGQISFLVQGDESGVDGWVRTPGKTVRRLATLSGGTGKTDDASLNALDISRPYNLSLYLADQTTGREQIQSLAASINSVAGVSWLGKLFVVPVAIGSPVLTLAADGSQLPPVVSVEQVDVAAPFKALGLQAERTWQVHELAEIAFTAPLIDRGIYSGTATYREGNIVTLTDGSRWLYVATAATSGNAPPNATYWAAFAGSTRNTVTRSITGPGSPITGDFWIVLDPLSGNALATRTWDGTDWVSAADVTLPNAPFVTVANEAPTVDCDYQGTVTGAYPKIAAKVTRNGASIAQANGTTYAVLKLSDGTAGGDGGTVSVDNSNGSATKGQVTTGPFDTGSNLISFVYQVTVDGILVYSKTIRVMKALAAPPAGGGSGSGGGGSGTGSNAKAASAPLDQSFSATSYAAASSAGPVKVTIASGDKLKVAIAGGVVSATTGTSGRTLAVKARYATSSAMTGATDFGTAVNSTSCAPGRYFSGEYFDPIDGSITLAQSVSGLSAGDYWVDVQAALNTSGKGVSVSGTVNVKAEP